ncbi:MAG TPA: hypothetical protein VFJ71_00285, partial [Candidatus Limnocylindrales bacterium]|nr:hypothetical protein [Candidatus Limnocylindrales bacterium]
ARWGTRIRLAILIAVALLVAHTAIYAAEDGLGAAYAAAIARDGHGDWWLALSVVVLALGLALGGWTVGRVLGLEIRARRARPRRREEPPFAPEAVGIARRLVPLVLVLFGIQENIEQLVAHGRVLGVEAVVGPAHPLAIPVLALVALILSIAGAAVRWRIATLERRVANGRSPVRRRIGSDTIGSAWRTVGALAPWRWMSDRLDAGRSPPSFLPA